jgi:iron-sulfur cluster assembly accessory protein
MTTPEDAEYSDGTPITDETHGVLLSRQASTKARNLLESEGRNDLRLRVQVSPGGCSGLIYSLYFDDRVLDGDAITDHDGLELIIDKMSAPYLIGASIDFEDSISKQGFQINNPNASGSCACGDSFH